MAVLDSSCAATGDRVEVALGDGNVAATVATLPIYDPGKARPRA
jgi:glycine cleavage system aminomethyltransferase T